jgi:hypothetical protein
MNNFLCQLINFEYKQIVIGFPFGDTQFEVRVFNKQIYYHQFILLSYIMVHDWVQQVITKNLIYFKDLTLAHGSLNFGIFDIPIKNI